AVAGRHNSNNSTVAAPGVQNSDSGCSMNHRKQSCRVMGVGKWGLAVVVMWAVTWVPASSLREIILPSDKPTGSDTASCRGLTKVHLVQDEATIFTPFVQLLRFMTDDPVPDLVGFTLHTWFNLDSIDKNATFFTYTADSCNDHWPGICIDTVDAGACSCSEAHANGWCETRDFVTNNCQKTCGLCPDQETTGKSTLITLKLIPPHGWELTIMGLQMLVAESPSVEVGTWHHLLVSWHSEAPTSLWMDGTLIHQQHNKQMDSLIIPGGGEVKVGQTEEAFQTGVDKEGLQGWITLFNLDSRAIKKPDDTSSKEKVSRLYSKCGAIPKGHDIIEWTKTPRKGHGGSTTQLAQEQCHHF
ncbi:unnamed protein product, partial [Meganyctiphanes norvegica]